MGNVISKTVGEKKKVRHYLEYQLIDDKTSGNLVIMIIAAAKILVMTEFSIIGMHNVY